MDKIILSNMRFRSHSGVLEEEKRDGQDFVVSLELELENIPACRTDNIYDTVDYGAVFQMVRDYLETTGCNLIEYMAENIIIRVFQKYSSIERITCEIKKPNAPIDGDFDYMGVVITRERDEMESFL